MFNRMVSSLTPFDQMYAGLVKMHGIQNDLEQAGEKVLHHITKKHWITSITTHISIYAIISQGFTVSRVQDELLHSNQ
jgi:aryl-phospho-beta-D-glucosidase BglC (GH1 family)